ncbi:hypothetical protein ASD62_14915 [Phycicoccus sp. Root563]|uniref:hypothetical protein n=1 Tax=Phycicoccus sp. Root563 TaxID=1736562 RepID=UPI000702FE69|nr:hypothetical protein [Phycicoccus sp. Root563]KQZ90383.1 hypothetical protein ASD62_14915 [Phycicoccus sp. Root563]
MLNRFVFMFAGAVLGAVLLTIVASATTAPVTLVRTRRFARRQELLVTSSNGPLVVRALAVTHRWRVLGLTTGLVLGVLWALRDARLTISFSAGFLGWFVGAVVAEWRLAGLPVEGGRRTASLTRRTVRGYLRMDSTVLLALACLALAGLAVAVVARSDGDGAVVAQAAAWLLVAALGLGALWATLLRVVSRPQPGSSAELVAADDALRARSANVLAGSAIVAAGYPAASLLTLMADPASTDSVSAWGAASLTCLVATVVVGWLVAVRRSPVRTRPAADVVATSPGVAP